MNSLRNAEILIDEAISIISNNEDISDFTEGATEEDIRLSERLLDIKFPNSYKKFLLVLGVGDFNGREFFGIVPGQIPGTSTPSAVWFTLDERVNNRLPEHFIVIGATGYGSIYCIDTSKSCEGECKIVEWNGNEARFVAGSFGEFFLSELKSSLES